MQTQPYLGAENVFSEANVGQSPKMMRVTEIARTAMIVAVVCSFMPFLTLVHDGASTTFSLYRVGMVFYKYGIAKVLPQSAASLVLMARAVAWLIMITACLLTVMLLTKRRDIQTKWIIIFCLFGFVLCFWMFFYMYYLFSHHLPGLESLKIKFEPGGICMALAFMIAAMVMLTTRIKKRTTMAALLILLVIPATILFGIIFLNDRKEYFISLLIITETMIPFFMIYEERQPEARELVVISVIAALAIAGRAAFFMLPFFKPVTAIVIIAAVCLGPEAGFLCGALAAFGSNFFFGQGPWTPWQMFSYGIIGFLAGILFKKGILKKNKRSLCVFGFITTLLIYGGLMDTCSLFMWTANTRSWALILSVYAMGFSVNLIHATATAFFLFVLSKAMIEKLDRIKRKYGMMEP